MVAVMTKASLPPARERLVKLMQEVNFGRILEVPVRGGEPVIDRPLRVVREIKFGGENGPRPEATKLDFTLKAPVLELFTHMEAIGDGVIPCIEIQRGLPFRMTVEEVCA